ncbi:type II and III secretion system protein family protein [Propylenella binzhouense]|uniref:Type II and III secretion system protein family protein n=1 Tax=Propylenella binzhouense TaxID=2555902 RepID=A0A964T571_9HYPH|nr:type II and III secretion system protein family protein [Propylenella binzhouense]MYZ48673.1 type II and III secretion system protein family protein [Propylenella binzhouense]
MIALATFRSALRVLAVVVIGLLAVGSASAGSDYLRLGAGDMAQSRAVRLGINKSMVIELPRPAGDVLVSNPAIADAVLRTSQRLYLIGVKLGQANIFLFDNTGAQIASFDVYVEADLGALNRLLSEAITDGWVKAEAMNGNIVLRGEVASASSSSRAQEITVGMLQGQSLGTNEGATGDQTVEKKVVNLLTITGVEQVSLKVTIAEVQRSVVKQLGIDTQAFLAKGNIAFGLANSQTGSFDSQVGQAALGWANGDNSVTATVKALEETNLIKTLAEPTLTAVSGETASFLAGGEFPFVTGIDQDTGIVTVDFKPFGVQLAFTPVVLSAGRISLKVRTEVSEIDSVAASGAPTLSSRRAETTVELPSGGAFVIGGLIQESTRRAVSGLPVIQKIPVLGALFSSKDFQRDETELVMIVTPYLVKPTSPSKLARPSDGLVYANDAEAIFLGQINKIYGSVKNQRPAAYHGQLGFAFD